MRVFCINHYNLFCSDENIFVKYGCKDRMEFLLIQIYCVR